MRNVHYNFYRLVTLTLFALPLLANAGSKDSSATSQLLGIICKLANYMFTLAIVLSVIMTLYAAFKYMIASGDASKVEEAHKTLIYVAVGVAVAILAGGMPFIIGDLLGSPLGGGGCK